MMRKKKRIQIIIGCMVMSLLGLGLAVGTQTVLESYRMLPDVEAEEAENSEEAQEASAEATENASSEEETDSTEDSEEVPEPEDWELQDLEDYSDAPQDNGCPYYVKVNRTQNVVTIYELDDDGYYTVPVKAMVCSVGADNATPTGTYTTSDKHEWSALVGGVYGQYAYRINGQIMFHSVPYYSKNKDDLESEEYNKLGTAASLGCIRLSVSDVKWIYDNCPTGTIVTIYDSDYPGPLGKPVAEQLDLDDERSCWDPTDPDVDNPWNDGTIRILGTGTRTLERGYSYDLAAGVVVLDGEGNDLTEYLSVSDDVDARTEGRYTATFQVSAPGGRTAQVRRTIWVKDTLAPEVTLAKEPLTLSRIQASAENIKLSLTEQIHAIDAGQELAPEHLVIEDVSVPTGVEQTEVEVYAVDDSGNTSEPKKISVYIDWEAPEIGTPSTNHVSGTTDEEIRQALLAVIPVTDVGSGIDTIEVTWTKKITVNEYSVMVIATDNYGNVTTNFFDNFYINQSN